MANPLQAPLTPLGSLREQLDTIDAEIHRLLAERFRLVADIGRTKGPTESIFRPAREAEVLSARLEANDGAIPVETLAHFWRTIISGSCLVQRPFTVHIADTLDAARFLYGPVPFQRHDSAAAAVAALAEQPGDIAVIRVADLLPYRRWLGFAHIIGRAAASSTEIIFVFGGAGVEMSGATAFVAAGARNAPDAPLSGDVLREIAASAVREDDVVLGRYDPFPVQIPLAR